MAGWNGKSKQKPVAKKTSKSRPITTLKDKYAVCLMCGKTKTMNQYYASNSLLHKNSHVPYCKECIRRVCSNEDGRIDVEKFKQILKEIDRPFIYNVLSATYAEYVNNVKSKARQK